MHAEAPTYETTDWPGVLQVYDLLLAVWPTPVVALNRTVALAMVRGPAEALAAVEELERSGRLDGYRYLPRPRPTCCAVSAGRAEAAAAYRVALDLADNEVERAFLRRRLTEVSAQGVAAAGVDAGPRGHRGWHDHIAGRPPRARDRGRKRHRPGLRAAAVGGRGARHASPTSTARRRAGRWRGRRRRRWQVDLTDIAALAEVVAGLRRAGEQRRYPARRAHRGVPTRALPDDAGADARDTVPAGPGRPAAHVPARASAGSSTSRRSTACARRRTNLPTSRPSTAWRACPR